MGGSSNGQMATAESVVADLAVFVDEEEFQGDLEAYCVRPETLEVFAQNTEGQDGHSLAMTVCYKEFCGIMETHLAKFEQQQGLNSEQVIAKCQEVKQAGGSDAWFVDALCASAEYESFVELMEGMVSEHCGSGGPVEGSFREHTEQDMTGGIELQESMNK